MFFLVVAIAFFAVGLLLVVIGGIVGWRHRQVAKHRLALADGNAAELDDLSIPFWGKRVFAGVTTLSLSLTAYSKVPETGPSVTAMPARDWHLVLYSCGTGHARHQQMVTYVRQVLGFSDVIAREKSERSDKLAATSTVIYYGDARPQATAMADVLGRALNTQFTVDAGAGTGAVLPRPDRSLIVNLIAPGCAKRTGFFGLFS